MRDWIPRTPLEWFATLAFPLFVLIQLVCECVRRRPYDYYAEVLKRQ